MQYSQKKIAGRVEHERNRLGWSKGKLADELNANRNTITVWERQDKNGRVPPLDTMLKMCGLFNCELTYLLGEHECRTRAATDVQAITGLSETSIVSLSVLAKKPFVITQNEHLIVDFLLCNEKFHSLLAQLDKYGLSDHRAEKAEAALSYLPDWLNKSGDIHPAAFVNGYARDIAADITRDACLLKMSALIKDIAVQWAEKVNDDIKKMEVLNNGEHNEKDT